MAGVDDLSDFRWGAEMLAYFGARRMTEIMGYAFMFGATGKTLPSEIVAALVPLGFSKSALYRTLADVRRFNVHLEEKYGETVSMSEILEEIERVSSHKRETVV